MPRPGIIVEPYFNSVKKFRSLKSLSEDEIANQFLINDINYIIFDLKRPIDNVGSYITKKFIQKKLEVVESKDQIYLLKINNNFENKNLNFYNLVDLKLKLSHQLYLFTKIYEFCKL